MIKKLDKRSNSRLDFRIGDKNIAKSKRSNSRLDFRIGDKNIAKSKRSQVTIFIIIAIVIVGLILGFFLLRDRIGISGFPAKFQPIETRFLNCLQDETEKGKQILGASGGYIYMPEFEAGTKFAPFSSQMDFLGQAIPYWYYVSGADFVKEQVPSKSEMENQLGRYIEENFKCDFSDYYSQGYDINYTNLKASVKINANDISVSVDSDLYVSRENETARQTSHSTKINTNLGKFYNEAIELYNYEKKEMFLEKYGVDILRLYAPVDGVEISCAPKTWIGDKVVSDLQDAMEANTQELKASDSNLNAENKYFFIGKKIDNNVNFIYSRNFPQRIEIWPAENNVMIAEPVGNQEGLGILGFCYVRYHFVYDFYYPILIQIYDNDEMFQFPVAVVIQKNNPRNAIEGEVSSEKFDLCEYKNSEILVYTYNLRLEPVEADISFKCFEQECNIGITAESEGSAVLSGKFPQCVNGFIIARAEGYAESKQMFSSNQEGIVDIILDKLYDTNIDLEVGGKSPEQAIVYFTSEDYSATLVWPEQKSVKLKQGAYNISVYSYMNSSLNFPASSTRKCIEISKPGLLGLFGGTQEQCFDINMPLQQITNVLSGGGKTGDYFTEDRLENGLKISAPELPIPSSLEQLEKNYAIFDAQRITVSNQ